MAHENIDDVAHNSCFLELSLEREHLLLPQDSVFLNKFRKTEFLLNP